MHTNGIRSVCRINQRCIATGDTTTDGGVSTLKIWDISGKSIKKS